jgi:CBS domain-containing protein
MKTIPENDNTVMLDEECPGPPDLESALASESVGDAASHPPLVADEATPIATVLDLMRDGNRGGVLVARGGRLIGIFTERDVLMKIAGRPIDCQRTSVAQVMTANPVTLPPDATVAFALNKMLIEGFRHIPLVDDQGHSIGVVSMRDLIEYLSGFFNREVLNLPPDPRMAFRNRDGA